MEEIFLMFRLLQICGAAHTETWALFWWRPLRGLFWWMCFADSTRCILKAGRWPLRMMTKCILCKVVVASSCQEKLTKLWRLNELSFLIARRISGRMTGSNIGFMPRLLFQILPAPQMLSSHWPRRFCHPGMSLTRNLRRQHLDTRNVVLHLCLRHVFLAAVI